MLIYAFALAGSFLLTWIVKLIAGKKSLMDIPNERSSHSIPTPRGGGMAIVIVWFSGISFMYLNHDMESNLYFALMCGSIISIISFLDDIYDLPSYIRFSVQFLAAGSALYFLGGLSCLDLGFAQLQNQPVLTAFAFIGILWFVNLFNFVDGIDGYAASESIFVALALFVFIQDTFLLLLAAAVLGFLPWNWQKAKIFMGDVGSTLLGFTFAVLAIYYQNHHTFSILHWLILTSVFWFDATYTLIRRIINKEKFFQGHRKHIYQRLVISGFSHGKTVVYAMFVNTLLFILLFLTKDLPSYSTLVLAVCITFLFLIKSFVDKRQPFL